MYRLRAVAENLEFDVLGAFDELLDEDPVITEGRERSALAESQCGFELIRGIHHLNPDATATGRGLDHHRVADDSGCADGLVPIGHRLARTLSDWQAGLDHGFSGGQFVTQQPQHLGPRPDELDALLGQPLSEGRVLSEEPIARVDSIGSNFLGRFYYRLDVQIGGQRVVTGDEDALVGQTHGERESVVAAVSDDRFDSKSA